MITLVLIVLFVTSAAVVAAPQPKVAKHHTVRCQEARRAVVFYRQVWSRWRVRMEQTGAQDAILAPCWHLRRARLAWRTKALAAKARWAREFNWPAWLPDVWARLGACETGGHVRPGNWHHQNSSFVSAFGISRSTYDGDAAVYGAPPWDDRRNPTPHQQYLAGLGHYHRFGGFSGWGCRGA